MEGTAELFTGFAERIAREKGTQQEMMREGDYIEDGLIHCGKCRGKRQTRVKIPGGDGATITVPCICKCEAKAEEDRKKQEEARQELQRMERLRSASLIENRLKNANLATFQQNKDSAQLFRIVGSCVQEQTGVTSVWSSWNRQELCCRLHCKRTAESENTGNNDIICKNITDDTGQAGGGIRADSKAEQCKAAYHR